LLEQHWPQFLELLQVSAVIEWDSLLVPFSPLLCKALDHPSSTIAAATQNFWNATFGKVQYVVS
jgi:hypothetical protein